MYTESNSKIGRWQGGAPNLSQAKPAPKQLNLYKLSDAGGLKGGGCPTQPEPIFESRAVYIKSLYLRNFRNYVETEVLFSPRCNVFYGDNAQGKTNLLEAIYLIATGRSFRTAHLQDLIRSGESFFFLEAHVLSKVYKEGFEHKIQISFDGRVKTLVLDGNSYATFQHLLGLLPSIFYTPSDIELIDGPPTIRRRFLNLHLAQRDPLYIHHFSRYWRAMKQRNALLRLRDTSSIECWETEMAESACYIAKTRRAFLKQLQDPFQRNGHFLSAEREIHEIRFHQNAYHNAEEYLAGLKKNRPREQQLGFTLTGPHRDDFTLWINQKASSAFGSEGQKKTSLFGLRLAEWELFSTLANVPAILGIDDLGVHLDQARRALLSQSLGKLGQVFVTAPNVDDHLLDAERFLISSGTVQKSMSFVNSQITQVPLA